MKLRNNIKNGVKFKIIKTIRANGDMYCSIVGEPTINPCTKGLWCWGTPLKGTSTDGEPVSIVVIDTEGIGALDEDSTHDTKIFTLAILSSSCFIYNSMGSIDETAIQNLSLVVNLSKNIQLKSSEHD